MGAAGRPARLAPARGQAGLVAYFYLRTLSPERALDDGELDVAAGTAWLWARAVLADSVDTLFVDEAGQLSLANVLAVAGAARNLVLLEHILEDRATMPTTAGLLLDHTRRVHPDLCRYTSAASPLPAFAVTCG